MLWQFFNDTSGDGFRLFSVEDTDHSLLQERAQDSDHLCRRRGLCGLNNILDGLIHLF